MSEVFTPEQEARIRELIAESTQVDVDAIGAELAKGVSAGAAAYARGAQMGRLRGSLPVQNQD